ISDAVNGSILNDGADYVISTGTSVTVGSNATQTIIAGVDVSNGSFDATSSQSSSFLARATNVTSWIDKKNYDNLITGLVADGVWAKLDVLYIFAAPNSATAL